MVKGMFEDVRRRCSKTPTFVNKYYIFYIIYYKIYKFADLQNQLKFLLSSAFPTVSTSFTFQVEKLMTNISGRVNMDYSKVRVQIKFTLHVVNSHMRNTFYKLFDREDSTKSQVVLLLVTFTLQGLYTYVSTHKKEKDAYQGTKTLNLYTFTNDVIAESQQTLFSFAKHDQPELHLCRY